MLGLLTPWPMPRCSVAAGVCLGACVPLASYMVPAVLAPLAVTMGLLPLSSTLRCWVMPRCCDGTLAPIASCVVPTAFRPACYHVCAAFSLLAVSVRLLPLTPMPFCSMSSGICVGARASRAVRSVTFTLIAVKASSLPSMPMPCCAMALLRGWRLRGHARATRCAWGVPPSPCLSTRQGRCRRRRCCAAR